jgi:hypothetical protein
VNDGLHYISEASAIVGGYVANVLSGVLRGLAREGTFDRLPAHQRAEVLRVIASIEHAGGVWLSRRGAVSGPASPVLPPGDAGSAQLTTEEAAEMLGIQPRQMRKLALAGLGYRLGSRWVFDRASILAEQQRREAA